MNSSKDSGHQVTDSGDMAEEQVDGKSGLWARGLQRQAHDLPPESRGEQKGRRLSLILPWNVAFFSQLERVIRKWPWEPWEWGRQTPFTQSRRR